MSSCKIRAAPHKNAQLHKNVLYVQITSKVTVCSQLANGKQYCSRTATGQNRRDLKGKSDIRSFSVRRPPIRVPFFCTKCLRDDVKTSFSGEGRCHIAERMLDFNVKPSVEPKSQFRATTRWRLLIPSIQKSFFSFSRSAVEGEGPRYHALRANASPVHRWWALRRRQRTSSPLISSN